jgi:hypothetical protein
MDHLYEYVKECISYTRTFPDCQDKTDDELFDVVMENVVSSVEHFSLANYKMAQARERGESDEN